VLVERLGRLLQGVAVVLGGVGLVAAAARLLTAFDVWRDAALTVSAAAWVLAFSTFALCFGSLLLKPRAHC